MSFDYFDRVYCIHLPNPERRKAIERQFKIVGIKNVQYIHAKPPAPGFHMTNMRRAPLGEFGCSLSHIKAAVHALADGAKCPLFLEDDVIFSHDAFKRMGFIAHELPARINDTQRWDILYLGGHPRGPCHMISDNLVKVSTFSFAESYAIPDWALPGWVDFWLDRVGQKKAMVDIILGEFADENNGFAAYPTLTHQPDGISQITWKHDSKQRCLNKGWSKALCADSSIKSA
jgi:hypothetical protein